MRMGRVVSGGKDGVREGVRVLLRGSVPRAVVPRWPGSWTARVYILWSGEWVIALLLTHRKITPPHYPSLPSVSCISVRSSPLPMVQRRQEKKMSQAGLSGSGPATVPEPPTRAVGCPRAAACARHTKPAMVSDGINLGADLCLAELCSNAPTSSRNKLVGAALQLLQPVQTSGRLAQ